MNNTNLHGKFKEIDNAFIDDVFNAFGPLEEIQNKYGKSDNDTCINEARDAKVAQILGYTHINTDKHGWDAKNDKEFLEVKQASISSKSLGATFNDTSIEKTEEISGGNVAIALAVWSSLKNLLFIVYGNNPNIGDCLKEKIKNSVKNKSIRPGTQTITLKDLLTKYGFKVKPVNATEEQVSEMLNNKIKSLRKIMPTIPFVYGA